MSSSYKPKLDLTAKKGKMRLEAQIRTQINKNRVDFVSELQFYRNNQKIKDLQEMSQKEFEAIKTEYKDEIDDQENSGELLLAYKEKKYGPLGDIKNIFQTIKIAIKSLNIIMIDEKGKAIIRTTIELDADVFTVLKPNLELQKMKRLVEIYGINVYFVNKFFKLHVFRFMRMIRKWIWIVRGIIAGVGTFDTLYELKFATILLYRYWKKIVGPIVRWIIKKKIGNMLNE